MSRKLNRWRVNWIELFKNFEQIWELSKDDKFCLFFYRSNHFGGSRLRCCQEKTSVLVLETRWVAWICSGYRVEWRSKSFSLDGKLHLRWLQNWICFVWCKYNEISLVLHIFSFFFIRFPMKNVRKPICFLQVHRARSTHAWPSSTMKSISA